MRHNIIQAHFLKPLSIDTTSTALISAILRPPGQAMTLRAAFTEHRVCTECGSGHRSMPRMHPGPVVLQAVDKHSRLVLGIGHGRTINGSNVSECNQHPRRPFVVNASDKQDS
ncbi:hypothetical protein AcV7_009582 [Taiwanofungus camphoratus]|nr:hypothetical protein AcV7_009582 [Antrodia cinnamomea]